MRPASFLRRAGLALSCLFALSSASAFGAPRAVADPACGGVDLVARLARKDKAAYAAYRAEAAKIPNVDGLLWRVEKPGVAASHLFGTFHASDARLIAKIDRAAPVVRRAAAVATELGDLSKTAKALALARVAFSAIRADHRSLQLVADEGRRARLVKLAEARGLDGATLDKMAPWMLVGLFALPACELAKGDRQGVDDRVVALANESAVPVEALESVEEQVEVLSTIEPRLVGDYLSLIADKPEIVDDGFTTMVGLYARSQVGAALPALKYGLGLSQEQFAMNDAFSKRLLGDRNETMRRRATPLLEKGRAFVAVGALHLSGADGLVALLRRDGWKVTKVW